jgi:hypothetical protein
LRITIGSASADSGEKSHGFVQVSRSSAGLPIGIPVNIVNGKKEGPTLVASGAMHGSEVIGTCVTSRLFKNLDPSQMKGVFIGVPVMNTWAFEAEHRVAQVLDPTGISLTRFDLARLFPGNRDGSIADLLAYTYMSEIARRADCLIDFHGQDHFWHPTSASIVAPPAPLSKLKPAVYEKCIELSKVFGVRQIWRNIKPGRLTATLNQEKDVPAIGLEFGGVTGPKPVYDYVARAIRGVMNVMKWLNMTDGEVEKWDQKTCLCELNGVNNRFGGIWETAVEIEDEVKKGDTVGTVSDPYTAEILEEIRAPISGVVTNLWSPLVIKPCVGPVGVGRVLEYV